jgi:DUF1365 family protein
MNSSLYNCSVYHARTRPNAHKFNYKLFMFCIDLDDVEAVTKNPLISRDSRNIYSFKTTDHLQFGKSSIRENLLSYLETCGHNEPVGRIRLITNLRTFGYQFNPVSFYFIETPSGEASAVVAEVANTYNEQKLYYLGPETKDNKGEFQTDQSKKFYISPFSHPDTMFHFRVSFPEDGLRLSINQSDDQGIYFKSGIKGIRKPLSTMRLIAQTLRFPFITVQVMVGIHWHALMLFLKKNPVYRKRDNLEHQTKTRQYLSRSTAIDHQPQV